MANDKKLFWVGFDLGGTKMMAAVVDEQNGIIARKKRKTRARLGADSGLERIVKTIRDACAEAKINENQISGIGLGVPGMLDPDRGIIHNSPNLGWKKVRVKRTISKTFGCPVEVLNDVDAGLYGEYCYGAAHGARNIVGIFPGTGIGGSCIYEGRIIRGKNHSCMEIGHVHILTDGPLCGCGQRGCLETVASRLAISSAAAAAAYRGEAPHLLEIAGTDLSNIRSNALAASINAGDTSIERIVRQAAEWLGIGVAMTVNLLLPDIVVLGGGLVEAMPDIFREVVEDTARKKVVSAYKNAFRTEIAQLGDDAVIQGAAAWIRSECSEKG
jgi:glucokinase